MQPQVSSELGPIFVFILGALAILLVAVVLVITLVAYCKISAKTGYSWAWGLLILVPFGSIILPLFLAFADWPVHKELRQLRQRCGGTPT